MAAPTNIQDLVTAVDLLGVEGPGEGIRTQLDPDEPLQIGRGLRGLEVPDPLVSLQHARIEWTGKGYQITDLNSAKGTILEGERLKSNEPAPLVIGMRFTVGDTTFELVERHAGMRRAAEFAALGAMALVLLGALIWVLMPAREPKVALLWGAPIHQGDHADRELAVDAAYLRLRGLDPRKLRIRRVTDADADGVDEVWLKGPRWEYAITFDAEGNWTHLGTLPLGCADVRNAGAGLPILECGPTTWAILDGTEYEPLSQEGAVLWGVPRESWKDQPGFAPSELVKPWQVSLRRPPALAGFLAANGVDTPVHYLVCEEAFPGVPPLVLTERGSFRTLSTGCRAALGVSGLDLESVRAIAFTATGYTALMDDLQVHLSGSTDGVFRKPEHDALSAAWNAVPTAGPYVLSFEAQDHFFAPVAAERTLAAGVRRMPAKGTPMPRATTATLVGPGEVGVDPEGCAKLRVEVARNWSCQLAQACVTSGGFLTVRDVGCGDGTTLVSAPYTPGSYDGTVDDLEVRVQIEGVDMGDRVDVHRARVAWRKAPPG